MRALRIAVGRASKLRIWMVGDFTLVMCENNELDVFHTKKIDLEVVM